MRTTRRSTTLLSSLPLLLLVACFGPVAPPQHVEVRPHDVGMEHDVVPGASVAPHGWEDVGAAEAAGQVVEPPGGESEAIAEGAGVRPASASPIPADLAIAPDVESRLARFSPTPIEADLSSLSAEDRRVLALVVEASRLLDPVFLRQVWEGNPGLARAIAGWSSGARGAAREYFELNFGPWDRLDELEPFIGSAPHPPGAGYYPPGMTRDELEAWLAAHPGDREAFISPTTVIRRDGDGGLVAVPYSTAYRDHLEPAAALLEEAAAETSNASLSRFLRLRAAAFRSDDYYESDLAWMDLDAPVEVTIGPYETYEDRLFGYKTAFESFVTVALPAESAALDRYEAELPWLERNLPIPDEHKNFERGSESTIRVVDEVFTAGDARAGVAT
ncbi:MAG TPA: hypothetical protein VM617_08260, partial [Thermoanaerobaculia bacterium]|nr:hypothetical protein [Thermoanaerobaculia bacterium]